MLTRKISDYALIGDTHSAALVGLDGSIDWACMPRFDSGACFAALLGDPSHGRWLIAPAQGQALAVTRRYLPDTLVLETTFRTASGAARLIDFMTPRDEGPLLVRLVEGLTGEVALRMELILRFDYGAEVPWVLTAADGTLRAVAGPDAVRLRSSVAMHGRGMTTTAELVVRAGQRESFVLAWHPSHLPPPPERDPLDALSETTRFWEDWSARCTYQGPWREAVVSSLRVLKALTYAPTGGIVAAPTTSLPEWPGGVRNWDYRYCWLRDATFTLYAFMVAGYHEEAAAWRDWLLRAVAGDPGKLQIMYGLAGERRLPELTLPWLPGFLGSAPVRVGNEAARQLQLDVYGEVLDALYQGRQRGLAVDPAAWELQRAMLEFLEGAWDQPDEGMWEVRGPRQQFTHSKVMAWAAFDRAVKTVETMGLEGPVDHWRALRDRIHADVCANAWHPGRSAFTQAYGSDRLDASVLLMAHVGFLPPSDLRFKATVAAIERGLLVDGFVMRYAPEQGAGLDGLPPGEGAFLACTFWLADCYALMGRTADATALFERLLALRNDVGLLAEEYDPQSGQLLGNFPQAFSHVGLINTAFNLTPNQPTPAAERKGS